MLPRLLIMADGLLIQRGSKATVERTPWIQIREAKYIPNFAPFSKHGRWFIGSARDKGYCRKHSLDSNTSVKTYSHFCSHVLEKFLFKTKQCDN